MFGWFFSGKNNFLLHVFNEQNKIVGYCGGFSPSYKGDGSTSGMMRYAMKEAITGAISHPALLFHKEVFPFYPVILKNIFRKIFKKKIEVKEQDEKTAIDKRIGLVVIGVHPLYRNKGVFELLMTRFEKEAFERNIHTLTLSVKKDNKRAVNAYKKIGWQVFKEENKILYMTKALAY